MLKIDGMEIESRLEVWSVAQKSTDGEEREIAFDGSGSGDAEAEARRYQAVFGGRLLKRQAFFSCPEEVQALSDEETLDLV